MSKNIINILGCICLILLVSCKKNKVDVPVDPVPTKTQLLVNKNWKLESLSLEIPYVTPLGTFQDIYGVLVRDCEKDNTYFFRENLTATGYENALKCNTTDPDSTNGVWTFIENDTKIVMGLNNPLPIDTLTVTELTATQLKFRLDVSSLSFFAGQPEKRYATGHFVKQ
ncbi:MAG: lipocalin family protein [Saprospiraceae bacterium]|nr:lipocalin family protein [Saprospiraceae bacterium]